ncbi:MAG: enoyl-CoA hydratase/isomerase family protein [Flavobacteriales bacterium]|nr:enoyl-CoA hydratase/isomerase family protein [Flavobacteriales bacterium]
MVDYNVNDDGIAVLTLNNPSSVNVINGDFIDSYEIAIDKVLEEKDLKGVIVASAKKDFMVGGDLELLLKAKDAQQVMDIANRLDAIMRKLETCGKPVVAAMNGTALGGGYEIALACHRRILVDGKNTRIGLPEVTLGLLPGGGGTQRLPRLIGIQPALEPLLQGKRYRPAQAEAMGMVDELASDNEDLMKKATDWILKSGNATQPWDEKKFRIPGGGVQTPGAAMVFGATAGLLLQKTAGNYPAPKIIMNCVYEGLQMPFERALSRESRYFAKCVTSGVAKNMIRTLFYSLNDANKGKARPEGAKETKLETIGIVGAGMMGAGIAYVSAKAGLNVVLKDVTVEAAEKGKAYSTNLLSKQVSRGRMEQAKMDTILGRIKTTDKPSDVSDCQLVIEAVFEDRSLKAAVTKESESAMAETAIFASNTSTLPITGLAESSSRPGSFIGLHFFSPVDKMPLVEIIVGEKTSDDAIAMCVDYTRRIGKTPIVVNDGRGFFTSRVFSTYLFEGLECLAEGIPAAVIENSGKAAGMPVGPLAIADEVSIELMYKINKQTEADTGEKYKGKAIDIVNQFVEELERPGKKAKKGFYEYPDGEKKFLWPELKKLFPVAEKPFDAEEVRKRLLYRQAVEAVRAHEDNVITSAVDGDIGSILGIGFPPYSGGAFSFIDWIGVQKFVTECSRLEEAYGERFAPPELLKKMAAEGKTFYN